MRSLLRTLNTHEIPVLDLASYRGNGGSPGYLRTLARSLEELGFLAVGGHGVDLQLLDHCYAISKDFFARPLAEKLPYHYGKVEQRRFGNLGYFPLNSERAVDARLADLKEFFHIGPSLPAAHPMKAHYSATPWPDHEGFRPAFEALFDQLRACGDLIFESIAEWAGLDRSYARELIEAGNHVLRTLHYPPIPHIGEATWAAQHTGIQLLGLQPRASHPGLQIALPSGEWVIPGKGYEDLLIVNIGEMLSYLLAGRIRPTLHRVVSKDNSDLAAGEDRYAIVFFYHGNALQRLRVVGREEEALQVGTWLRKRLTELGLTLGE